MKNLLVVLSSVVMAAYVVYRGFVTFLIMPLAEPLLSSGGMYFLLLVLLAAGATALSFTRRKGLAAILAAAVGFAAVVFWCHDLFVASVWTRSDFIWLLVPELCFSLAGLSKWWVTRSRTLPEVQLGKVLR